LSPSQEFFGEGAAAGADFDDQLLGVGTSGRGDSFENGALDEKVLAESAAH
jgi:hypothetical protein